MKTHGAEHGGMAPGCGRWSGQSGMTLVFSLGFLCVLMMIMLTLAITARQERRAASLSSDIIAGRLIAQSAIDNAVASLKKGTAGKVYPADGFYAPGDSSAWHGRRYVASAKTAGNEGIDTALAVRFARHEFTPESVLRSTAGWLPVKSRKTVIEDGQSVERDVLLGRYAYVIIDESGKLDPGAVVSSYAPETVGERIGRSPTEIPLEAAGIPKANDFRPGKVSVGTPGSMPADGRWFSMAHIARVLSPASSDMRHYVERLHPYSRDRELFWRDRNANGVWDPGEDEERLGLAGSLSLTQMYDLFVGQDKESGEDDCAWLKDVDADSWFQEWRSRAGLSVVAARRLVAAQVAANIVDYSDGNAVPVHAYVDAAGNAHVGSYSGPFNLRGAERTWGISEIALRIQADQYSPDSGVSTPSGHDTLVSVGGRININPNNSPHMEFYLTMPGGAQITRDDLHQWGQDYQGAAVWVHVKPKGNGNQNSLTVNGEPYALANADTHDIVSRQMSVRLYNDRRVGGKAMGDWWIEITAANATITINDKGVQGSGASVDFSIGDGAVMPYQDFAASVRVLGAALSMNGDYDCPVTVKLAVGSDTYEPWGAYTLPLDANVNDGANPRVFSVPKAYAAGTPISIRSRVFVRRNNSVSGSSNADWQEFRTVDSSPANSRVLILRNGDKVPDVTAFRDESNIMYYISSYVHNKKIVLRPDQALYLYEFSSDLNGSGADWQDLAVLVTLADPAGLIEEEEAFASYPMTIWAISDASAKLYYYQLGEDATQLVNLEGNLQGVSGTRDVEAFTIDDNGVMYFMNNVGTSKLYKVAPEQLDRVSTTAVNAVYIGDTGLAAGATDSEITALQFVDGVLYGLGRASRRIYAVSTETGQVNEVGTLNHDSAFRTGGLTMGADGVMYLVRTLDSNSELWRFSAFPGGAVEKVCTIPNSRRVEALSAHPSGHLYAADSQNWFRIDPATTSVEVVTSLATDIEGMDFYYLGEQQRTSLGLPPPAVSVDEQDDPQPGTGGDLRVRVGVKGELYFPFATDAAVRNPPGSFKLTYTLEVATVTGRTMDITRTMTIPASAAVALDGGTLLYTPEYANDVWINLEEAFDYEAEPPLNGYTISKFQVDRVELRNLDGFVIDSLPAGGDPFCSWAHASVSYADESFYVSARCRDVMMNDRSASSPDFDIFWSVSPDSSRLGVGELEDGSDVGTLTYGGYKSAPYCGVDVKNGVFSRIGELGRVHSYAPLRSLRLWSANNRDTTGHDAALLDLFKIGDASLKRGKVNINSRNRDVLKALFAGATSVDAGAAADAVLAARRNGTVFTNIGEVFGLIPGVSGANPAEDAAEEAAVARLAELITVRQNYFTVIACAQAIRDVAGKPYRTYESSAGSTPTLVTRTAGYFYDTDGTGDINGLDVVRNAAGDVVRYVDRVLAEQKVLAVVYRDGFSNQTEIERIEILTD